MDVLASIEWNSTEGVIAVATVVLAAVTLAYVILTYWLVRVSLGSNQAEFEAALFAFENTMDLDDEDFPGPQTFTTPDAIRVTCKGASVWVHKVHFDATRGAPHDAIHGGQIGDAEPLEKDFPIRMTRGEVLYCDFGGGPGRWSLNRRQW